MAMTAHTNKWMQKDEHGMTITITIHSGYASTSFALTHETKTARCVSGVLIAETVRLVDDGECKFRIWWINTGQFLPPEELYTNLMFLLAENSWV